MKTKNFDLTGAIIEYEGGELNAANTLYLFSELVKTGQAWSLQGHYGRTASALIQDNFLTSTGELTDKAQEFIVNN